MEEGPTVKKRRKPNHIGSVRYLKRFSLISWTVIQIKTEFLVHNIFIGGEGMQLAISRAVQVKTDSVLQDWTGASFHPSQKTEKQLGSRESDCKLHLRNTYEARQTCDDCDWTH